MPHPIVTTNHEGLKCVGEVSDEVHGQVYRVVSTLRPRQKEATNEKVRYVPVSPHPHAPENCCQRARPTSFPRTLQFLIVKPKRYVHDRDRICLQQT